MTTDLRIVVDTNVFVSQLILPRSKPSEAVRAALRLGKLLTSEDQLRELFDVVMRPKFEPYVSAEVRLEEVRRLATLIEPVRIVRRVRVCRDPKDDMLLEIAINGGASHIVTGDTDLLDLKAFDGVPILKPADFLMRMRGP
jgi:putative PIN family toxin of toxin-antitoxin system